MNAVVVNCSAGYNLATHRLDDWLTSQGGTVQGFHNREGKSGFPGDLDLVWADEVYLSAVFSWDLPLLAELARRASRLGALIHIGGPAAVANADWVERETGVAPWQGRHPCAGMKLEEPRMTWTSRGCPNRCSFCLVPRIEGDLLELEDWQPAPVVMDNNFLACSEAHQERVIARLAEAGLCGIDFNQGLDAQRYSPAFRHLLERHGLKLTRWRFAYDRPSDWPALEAAVRDLQGAGVGYWDIQVYVLYGWRESPDGAIERAEQVIGDRESPLAYPWPMAYKPSNWMSSDEYVPAGSGWTVQLVRDFRRYYGRPQLWRSFPWSEYRRNYPRGAEGRGYPPDWDEIARRVKEAAGWRCEHCNHPHDPSAGRCLTVHHADGDPANSDPDNLVALCQRCHLSLQASFLPGQLVMDFARPRWMTERGLG